MSRFEGKLCPICRAPFSEKADVVVCPICGTPHHRNCYLSRMKCGVEEYHAQGFVWDGYLPDQEPSEQQSEPPAADPHHAEYPQGVMHTSEPDAQPQQFESMEEMYNSFFKTFSDETSGEDGVSMRELTAYAATSSMHYGRAFGMFRGGRRKVFVNVCSGLFAPVFQFYRKMDVFGIAVMAVMILTSLPTLLVYSGIVSVETIQSSTAYTALYSLCNYASFILTVLLCLFGDYIYYRHAVKRIKRIREGFGGDRTEEYYAALAESGKPSWLRAIIGFLIMTLAVACIAVIPTLVTRTSV